MIDDKPSADGMQCCACLNVVFKPIELGPGHFRERWVCALSDDHVFVRKPVAPAPPTDPPLTAEELAELEAPENETLFSAAWRKRALRACNALPALLAAYRERDQLRGEVERLQGLLDSVVTNRLDHAEGCGIFGADDGSAPCDCYLSALAARTERE